MLTRLLLLAGLCAAGTLNGAILGSATGTVLGIVTNILSNDLDSVWNGVAKRLEGKDAVLRNQDLSKAVGKAIAAVIASVAKEKQFYNYQEPLKRLANRAVKDWSNILEDPKFQNDTGFDPVRETNLALIFSQKAADFEQVRALTLQDWEKLLNTWQEQDPEAMRDSDVMRYVAGKLHTQFPKALREVLKEDFASGGKAFPALMLDLLGEIRGAISEQQAVILAHLNRIGAGSPDQGLLRVLETHNLDLQSAISEVNADFQRVDQKLTALQAQDTQAFQDLARQIESGFGNITDLLLEVGVIAEKTLAGIGRLEEGQETILALIRPTQKDNLEDAHPSTEHWQGREAELKKIRGYLAEAQTRFIGILGVGGLGKSTLAAKIYQEFEQDKRFWADLRQPQANFISLARRVLQQLGGLSPEQVKGIPEANLANNLVALLQRQRYLLVLDNLESLLQENGSWRQGDEFYEQFFCQWLQSGEKSQLLVTTREQPELPAIKARWLPLDEGLKADEGAALLQSLGILGAKEELKAFSVSVRGYPLSLMLVAGLLRVEERDEPHIRHLNRYGEIWQIEGLHGGEQGVSVEDVISWSWQRLTQEQQALLEAVSVHRPPFFNALKAAFVMPLSPDKSTTQEEIEAIVGTVEETLRQLTRRALLQEEPDKDRNRWFRLHPLILEYVQRQVDDLTEAHQRAIGFYQAIAPEEIESVNDLGAYQEIVYHQCRLGECIAVNDFLRNHNEWLSLRGNYTVLAEMNQNLVQTWQPANQEERENYSWALTRLGIAYNSLGQYPRAIEFHQQSLAIFQEISDSPKERLRQRNGEANSLINLGNAYRSLGKYQEAIAFHQESLAIMREIGGRQGEAYSLGNLGITYCLLGEYQEALTFHQESLAITREIGDRKGEASSLNSLGNLYHSLREYPEAVAFHEQSLAITREIVDRQGEANSLNNLGYAYQSLGQYREAIECYLPALEIYQQLGNFHNVINCLNNLGNTYCRLQQYSQAIQAYQAVVEIKRNLEDTEGEGRALITLAQVYQQAGRAKEGFAISFQGIQILQELDLSLSEMPYPNWLKSLMRFAQRGKLQLVLCFIGGVIAFPFALIGFVLLLLWRWFTGFWRR